MDGAGPSEGRVPRLVAGALPLLVGALLLGAVFVGGDARDASVPWIGCAAVLLGAAGLATAALGLIELPRLDGAGKLASAGLLGLVAWAGLSIAWSVAGDHSWSALNKGIAYAGFLAVGLALCSLGTGTTRTAAGLLSAVIGAALLWALAGKAVPALGPGDTDRVARLQSPVGYWNGLALLADAAIALGLWLAVTASRRRLVRAAGALLVYLAVLVLLLTSSRAGALGGALALALWLWLVRERLQSAMLAATSGAPAAAVAGWVFTRPALAESGATHAARVRDGAVFGVVAVLGAAVAVWAGRATWRLVPGRERLVTRALVGVAIVLVAGGVALAIATGTRGFSQGECANDPGRLGSLCANNRTQWWREAGRIFVANPLAGAGAGTFEIARTRYRRSADAVTEPHSVPLQVLADTGIVGAALLAIFVGGAVVGVARRVRGLDAEARAAATALAALPAVYALHALVDYDLDFLALTGPALVAVGVLLGSGRPPARRGGPLGAVAVAVLAGAAVVSLGSPWLAARKVDAATRALDAGRLAQAVDDANGARSLDPLSPDPLYTLGEAAAQAGDLRTARARFDRAARLQPENSETWYQLGLFEFYGSKDMCAAYQAFNHAYTLDPKGREWTKGGELDQSRDAVNNDRACG